MTKQEVLHLIDERKYISEYGLRDDFDVALALVKWTPSFFLAIHETLQENHEIIRETLKGRAWYINHVKKELRDNPEFIDICIKQSAITIQYFSTETQLKYGFDAVKSSGRALIHLPETLRDDEKIVKTAMKSFPAAILWASERLKNKRDLVIIALRQSPGLFSRLHPMYTEDPVFRLLKRKRQYSSILTLDKQTIYNNLDVIKACKYSAKDRKKIMRLIRWIEAGNLIETLNI